MALTRSVVAALVLGAATLAAQHPADVFSTLGTTSDQAQSSVLFSFTSGAVALIGERSVFRSASTEMRLTLVRSVIAAARSYTNSADFAARYARFREAQLPQPEELPRNGEEALALQQKQLEEAIRQAEKTAENLSPEAREQLAHNISYTKQQLADLNADPEHRAAVDAAVKERAREAEAEYAGRMAEFEREYPSDAKRLVARRLREFLDLSATVDFSAKLVENNKRMRFVDPELEAKSREWKMLYRAGKPAVDAARAAAAEWLKALGE